MNKFLTTLFLLLAIAASVFVLLLVASQRRLRSQLADAEARLAAQSATNAQLAAELTRAANSAGPGDRARTNPATDLELLRLRGEVGKLRASAQEIAAAQTSGPSTLSGLTSNPEMFKMIRNQQKVGLGMIYQGFTNRVSMSPDEFGKLNDLLADNVMDNIERITEVLRSGKGPEEMEAVFTAQEAALREKVRTLLGDEGLAQYDDYTRNLLGTVTADQFKCKLSGEKDARDAKARQFAELLQTERLLLLAENGLTPDYQLVPTLNFRNFASDAAAERNLKLLADLYSRAAAKAGGFLSEAELASFAEFQNMAINGNRMALKLNRQMMSPGPR
jgi:hypothetical protein